MNVALDVALRHSALAHQLVFWLHVIPLALLPMAMDTGTLTVVIALAIGLSWVSVRRHAAFGFGPKAIVRIAVDAEGKWSIENPAGRRLSAELQPDSVIASRLLILNFRSEDGRLRTRVLLGDEAPADAMRRLRTKLASAAGISTDSSSRAEP